MWSSTPAASSPSSKATTSCRVSAWVLARTDPGQAWRFFAQALQAAAGPASPIKILVRDQTPVLAPGMRAEFRLEPKPAPDAG